MSDIQKDEKYILYQSKYSAGKLTEQLIKIIDLMGADKNLTLRVLEHPALSQAQAEIAELKAWKEELYKCIPHLETGKAKVFEEIEKLKEELRLERECVDQCFYHTVMRDPQINTHAQACDTVEQITKERQANRKILTDK